MNNAYEVVVSCDAWGAAAPWGYTTSEVVDRSTLEASQHMAAVIANEHSRKCLIEIRSRDGQTTGPVVESRRGERTCDECDQTELENIIRMIARRVNKEEVRHRIEWGRGHILLGDDECDALYVLIGDRMPPPPDGVRFF